MRAAANAAALAAAIKRLEVSEDNKSFHADGLAVLQPPVGNDAFDLLDFIGQYTLTFVNGVGWAPTIIIPGDAATVARLDDGEALRGAVSQMNQTHKTRRACACGKPHAPASAKPAAMAEAEAAGAAAAAARTKGKKYRGAAQLHETIKGAPGCARCRSPTR